MTYAVTHALTATRSSANTMTEARVRAVMEKIMANFTAMVVCDLIPHERANRWSEDLTYLQLENALVTFQVQFRPPGRPPYGIQYRVSNDGSVQQDSSSGGLDLYGIPKGTPVALCVDLRPERRTIVLPWLTERGWHFNGSLIQGAETESRSFSSGGYGVTRSMVGAW